MKKFFVAAFAMVAMSLSLISCGSPASKAESLNDKMLSAMENGDIDAYCEVLVEGAEYVAELDKDDLKEFNDADKDWNDDHEADMKKAQRKWDEALENASAKDKQKIDDAVKKAAKLAQGKSDDDDKKD